MKKKIARPTRIDVIRDGLANGVPIPKLARRVCMTQQGLRKLAASHGIRLPDSTPAKPVITERQALNFESPLPAGHPLAMSVLPKLRSLDASC